MCSPGNWLPSSQTITYQQVGLLVSLSASTPKDSAHKLVAQVSFQLSALADSGVEISPQVKATAFGMCN